jgi:hypothetical protein
LLRRALGAKNPSAAVERFHADFNSRSTSKRRG